MEQTIFEHHIFSHIGEYLEHCRKQLQSNSTLLFRQLDDKLTGVVVLFAFDTAKVSDQIFYFAPDEEWVNVIFRPHINKLSDLLKLGEYKHINQQFGTVLNLTPAVIEPLMKKLVDNSIDGNFKVFYSDPVLTGSFVVFTSIWFRVNENNQFHEFSSGEKVVPSLIEASKSQFLMDANVYMHQKLTYAGFLKSQPTSSDILLKKAGRGLLGSASMYFPQDKGKIKEEIEIIQKSSTLFDDLNVISKMGYEGSEARGSLLICDPNHENIDVLMEFTVPIWSHDHRQVRKLLEVAQDKTYLLVHKGDIYGLGQKSADYNFELEPLFRIEITGHAKWYLAHNEDVMMVVHYGQPSMRVEQKSIYLSQVEVALGKIFPSLTPDKTRNLKTLVEMAMQQHHGTMLVICDHAREESQRLKKQSIHIKPTLIDSELMKVITAIDGAVLIDSEGNCYAIGVILDGFVEAGEGDPSRGARYHAALKYLNYARRQDFSCLIIVVSEDGMINIFPTLVDE